MIRRHLRAGRESALLPQVATVRRILTRLPRIHDKKSMIVAPGRDGRLADDRALAKGEFEQLFLFAKGHVPDVSTSANIHIGHVTGGMHECRFPDPVLQHEPALRSEKLACRFQNWLSQGNLDMVHHVCEDDQIKLACPFGCELLRGDLEKLDPLQGPVIEPADVRDDINPKVTRIRKVPYKPLRKGSFATSDFDDGTRFRSSLDAPRKRIEIDEESPVELGDRSLVAAECTADC